MTVRHPNGLVVGVDGTHGGRAALSFAIREAARRSSPLEVVTAWNLGEEDGSDVRDEGAGDGIPQRTRQGAQHVQDHAVALALREVDARPVLSRQVVEGNAGQVLLRVAKDADYLVVGSSKDDPARLAPLGRVTYYCMRHASCAVVVVPSPTHTSTAQ